MRYLWAIVAIAATSSAMAETPNDKELRACLTEVVTNHVKAKAALFSSTGLEIGKGGIPQLTIDFYMKQRRLDETYCMQYARCVVTFTKPPENLADTIAGTHFASCLADEAAEGTQSGDQEPER
jgi:hypothetical protein